MAAAKVEIQYATDNLFMVGLEYVVALGGNFNTGGRNNQGSNGNYWSSTVNSYQNAYRLNLNTSNVNPQNNNNKYNGNSVRCIAR